MIFLTTAVHCWGWEQALPGRETQSFIEVAELAKYSVTQLQKFVMAT